MHSQDYRRIERAMQYMEHHYRDQPSLDELAASVNLSRYHFQRLFTRWAGISPGRFLHCLTLQHAKGLLAERQSLLDAALETGLSGPGRLHDLFVTYEALSPGEYKRQGEGLEVAYGFHPTPFGECLVAGTGRGVCGLSFVGEAGRAAALAELRERLPRATFREQAQQTAPVAERIFGGAEAGGGPLHLLLHGTNFQVKVWEALLRIPTGSCATYQQVAGQIGEPLAARAVGQAVARNPIAYLVPCHRVIRKMGLVGGYRWGEERKRLLLAWEAARGEAGPAAAASA
jgi:AraC family transcriptional regulator, regulatory protein of adaptative response / methylated-DNA-[protein]-cysteine methyltransferase